MSFSIPSTSCFSRSTVAYATLLATLLGATPATQADLAEKGRDHWCWQPGCEVVIPEVSDADWPLDPIDHFVLAQLEARDMHPALPADRHALIRRLSLQLIGLPPTAEEVRQFVDDTSPGATERLVDRLLGSPHFGEHWARHWMDLVRYAETYGHEYDYAIPHASEYRNYLIRAFNADVPYDKLVREHIAGDLLSKPRRHPTQGTNESIIGTGFWWLGESIHAPTDVLEDQAERIDNQIDVVTKAFLALTVSCARCHDHKFDAISTQDYYALASYMQSTRRGVGWLDEHGQIATARRQIAELQRAAESTFEAMRPQLATIGAERIPGYLLAAREAFRSFTKVGEADRAELIDRIAAQQSLDPAHLQRWVAALSSEEAVHPAHPLFPWRMSADVKDKSWRHAAQNSRSQMRDHRRELEDFAADTTLFEDFAETSFGSWLVAGPAFGEAPTAAGETFPQADHLTFSTTRAAHSGREAGQLRGALRSKTFQLEHPVIYYRMKGTGGEIRLVVDGYYMTEYHSLLFDQLRISGDTKGQWVWVRQAGNLNKYLGHRAYIEVLDTDDGYIAIDEIRFAKGVNDFPSIAARHFGSGDLPIPDTSPGDGSQLDTYLVEGAPVAAPLDQASDAITWQAAGSWNSPKALAEAYGQAWVSGLQSGASDAEATLAADLVNYVLQRKLLDVLPSEFAELEKLHEQWLAAAATIPEPKPVLATFDGSGEDQHVYVRGDPHELGPVANRQLPAALVGSVQPRAPDEGSGRLLLVDCLFRDAEKHMARVAANRVWHHFVGQGIVGTVDNFGILGQPPTHPQLLDYLAESLVEGDWSIKQLLRRIALTRTFQMASSSTQFESRDPDNRFLHRAHLRRVSGEVLRDAMLQAAGQLDRKQGGPSVPIYLTGSFDGRGRPASSGALDGEGRRSVYLSVRRNFVLPEMIAFDMPKPTSCVGRRAKSNVPAQALYLMNSEFAHQQAERWATNLVRQETEKRARTIDRMFLAALSRPATEGEVQAASSFLDEQFKLHSAGERADAAQLAAWTDLCHVVFNMQEFKFIP